MPNSVSSVSSVSPSSARVETVSAKKELAAAIEKEVSRIENQSFGRKVKRFFANQLSWLMQPTRKTSLYQLADQIKEQNPSVTQEKIWHVLKLHLGSNVKLFEMDNGKTALFDKWIAITEQQLQEINQSVPLNGVELAYQFFLQNKSLPAGFLKNILVPTFKKRIDNALAAADENECPTTLQQQGRAKYQDNPAGYIRHLLEGAGIKSEARCNFERILDFKALIRTHLIPTAEVVPSSLLETNLPDNKVQLDSPKSTRIIIEQEDKQHIQQLSQSKPFFSKENLTNIVKAPVKGLLRNKRTVAIFAIDIIIGTLLASVFSAGITLGVAGTVLAVIAVSYAVFWSVHDSFIKDTSLAKELKHIQQYIDGETDNIGIEAALGTKEDDERVTDKIRYHLERDIAPAVTNLMAEMEKQAIKITQLNQQQALSTKQVVELETLKSDYFESATQLQSKLAMYDLYHKAIIALLARDARQYEDDLQLLWQHKFAHMDRNARAALFTKAGHRHDVMITEDKQEAEYKLYLKGLHILSSTYFKRGVKGSIFSSVQSWLSDVFKGDLLRFNVQAPVLPVSSIPYIAILLLLTTVADSANQRVELGYKKDIERDRQSYTGFWFWRRHRSGREEFRTLNKLAVQQLQHLSQHLTNRLQLSDQIIKTLSQAKLSASQDSRTTVSSDAFIDQISDEKAAELFILYGANQQVLQQATQAAFATSIDYLHKKVTVWNQSIALSDQFTTLADYSIQAMPPQQLQNYLNRLERTITHLPNS